MLQNSDSILTVPRKRTCTVFSLFDPHPVSDVSKRNRAQKVRSHEGVNQQQHRAFSFYFHAAFTWASLNQNVLQTRDRDVENVLSLSWWSRRLRCGDDSWLLTCLFFCQLGLNGLFEERENRGSADASQISQQPANAIMEVQWTSGLRRKEKEKTSLQRGDLIWNLKQPFHAEHRFSCVWVWARLVFWRKQR